jgi:hypothetical protein
MMTGTVAVTTKHMKSYYTETEAAEVLGVPLEQFRGLVRTHIIRSEDDPAVLNGATYQPSDLVVLRMLANLPVV